MVKGTVVSGVTPSPKTYIKKQLADGSWQPLKRVSRQKSILKKLFRERPALKEAFFIGDLPHKSSIGRVIEDCSYTLITFVKKQQVAEEEGNTLLGRDVVHFILQRAVDFFQSGSSNTYVILFDKPQHVPPNKQEEQLFRLIASPPDVEPYEWDPEKQPHVLGWNEPLPCSWSALQCNRAARRQAIKDIVTMIRDNYTPPAGKRLIIDSDTFKKGPLVKLANVAGTQFFTYKEKRLKNSIGEGDNSVLFYVKLFSQGGAEVPAKYGNFMDQEFWNGSCTDDILVYSNDTDIWLSLLMNYRLRQKGEDFVNRVVVRCGDASVAMPSSQLQHSSLPFSPPGAAPPLSVSYSDMPEDDFIAALSSKEEPSLMTQGYSVAPSPAERVADSHQLVSKVSEYIDINALFDGVGEELGLQECELPYALESLFVICVMGGNDYVDGYYGLSYPVLVRTWMSMYRQIGSLVEMGELPDGRSIICIRPQAYLSLLMRAYWQAYEKKNITQPNPDNLPKRPPKPNFPQPLESMSLQEMRNTVSTIRNKPDDHIPSNTDISRKMLRTQWYLRYCYYSDLAHPMKLLPHPLHSAWEEARVEYCTRAGVTKVVQIMTRK